jgi:hypothetical protein
VKPATTPVVVPAQAHLTAREVMDMAEVAEVDKIVHLADRGSPMVTNVASVGRWATGPMSADPIPRRNKQMYPRSDEDITNIDTPTVVAYDSKVKLFFSISIFNTCD